MARIIESNTGKRRIIRMSTDDIISVVKDYQRIVPRFSTELDARNYLSDTVIYIPEDVYISDRDVNLENSSNNRMKKVPKALCLPL